MLKQILKGVVSYLVVEKLMEMPFSFRVKMGQQEIEISGTREEVIKTIKGASEFGDQQFKGF